MRAIAVLVVVVLLGPSALVGPGAAALAATEAVPLTIEGGPTSGSDPRPVRLDADLYLPASTPAPAVVLAHGFGGSKAAVAGQAQEFADRGYVVVAYTARGFGASGGEISMNSPRFEVADARRVVDELARRTEVISDGPDDPRVAVAGGSYGGALALLLAGYDERVDAVAADITWNDLATSLFGQSLVPARPRGVFKQWWAGGFFSVGLDQPGGESSLCGRFTAAWCDAFNRVATGGSPTATDRAMLAASSPASVTDRITVPTLLGVGQADSLFPYSQALANYRQIRSADAANPVQLVWHGGGHDGGTPEPDRLTELTAQWFDAFLGDAPAPSTVPEVTLVDGVLGADSRRQPTVARVPDLIDAPRMAVALAGPGGDVRAPAGGAPAAVSSFPGIGGLAAQVGMAPPGQTVSFESAPLAVDSTVMGSPRVTLSVAADPPVRDVALFAQTRVVTVAGTETAPQGLVAPVRLERLGPTPRRVTIDLPAIATRVAAGDRLRVVVGTTDASYRLPQRPAIYSVAADDADLLLPVPADITTTGESVPLWLLGVLPLAGVVAAVVWALRPRAPQPRSRSEDADTPVLVMDVSKTYRKGPRAVADISFSVPRGVVLGLLGPNGAGKTTTMRMLMGLIRPTSGEMYLFGERVYAGAPVLSRVGSLVEGAGFLPHLSGRTNLELYWRATGRTGDPGYAQVLEIAGLGTAVDRKVGSYSQGMRQRLGIAQAMLGMPDLLMLDEPTNGLDPPQIREMRDVLRDYAATGRTVIVSSHMLAEVEMTCTHVVVMHRGRVVADGDVADLKSAGERLEDVFLDIVGSDRTVGGG